MNEIKFGTDGWRAIIAKEYTIENVSRVAEAVAAWLKQNYNAPAALIGYDCRFGGKMFAEATAKIMAIRGIKTFLSTGFVSTPMVSLGVVRHKASIGIIITASHNPPDYNGFKLKGEYGGPLLEAQVKEIEEGIEDKITFNPDNVSLENLTDKGAIEYIDLETLYCKHIEKNFDLKLIKKSGLKLAYDSMYGAGQNVIRRLLPDATLLHCVYNPSFGGTAPEPIRRNLAEFEKYIKKAKNLDMGLATDGDADRIGLLDGKGRFIDSHNIILLLINYLVTYKKMTGKVCIAFSVTGKVNKMCEHFRLPLQVVKVGFKYVCEVMLAEDVLIGGEESGGIAIKGHIPERDGIWIGLTILEYMARTGKSLDELIKEVLRITGRFTYLRTDLHLTEQKKQEVLKKCRENKYTSFGSRKINRVNDLDGFKFYLNEDEWLMIRASGTEPVLRLYAEGSSAASANAIMNAAIKTIRKD